LSDGEHTRLYERRGYAYDWIVRLRSAAGGDFPRA
jgi:hypothetical protein